MNINRVQGETVVEISREEAVERLDWWISLQVTERQKCLRDGTLANLEVDKTVIKSFTPVPPEDLKSILCAAFIVQILGDVVGRVRQVRLRWSSENRRAGIRFFVVDTVTQAEQFGDVELQGQFSDRLLSDAEMGDQDELKNKLLLAINRVDLLPADMVSGD